MKHKKEKKPVSLADKIGFVENPYAAMYDLAEAFKPQRNKRDDGYIRICAKGKFNLHCYDVGLLWVSVFVCKNYYPGTRFPASQFVKFYVGTADDGEWEADSNTMSQSKCEALVEKIKVEVLDDLFELPSEEKLKEQLIIYGLHPEE